MSTCHGCWRDYRFRTWWDADLLEARGVIKTASGISHGPPGRATSVTIPSRAYFLIGPSNKLSSFYTPLIRRRVDGDLLKLIDINDLWVIGPDHRPRRVRPRKFECFTPTVHARSERDAWDYDACLIDGELEDVKRRRRH
jgi:hypothetical protein